MEWYSTVISYIKKTFPELRKTRQTNLALLTYGILRRTSVCPSVIVRAWPLPTNHLTGKSASKGSLIIMQPTLLP